MKKIRIILLCLIMLLPIVGGVDSISAASPEAQGLLDSVVEIQPEILDGKIVLPTIDNNRYKIEIAGSSNEAVIDTSGKIYEPIEDMKVHLVYRVVNKSDDTDTAMHHNKDVVVTISGKYPKEDGDNVRPQVLPGIREWKGATGDFKLTNKSKIIIEDATLQASAETIAYYFKEMLNRDISISTGTPGTGDLYLKNSNKKELGKEGNLITIEDMVTVEGYGNIGVLYGGITLTQILFQDVNHEAIPKGIIRDYPAYEVRASMIDVARIYIPLDYVEEITKYMAYFKMNEVRLHINDDGGEQQSSFRIESKKFPAINTGLNPNEVYSQDDYRQYQKNVKQFGIDVVTEIDTPAHCSFVNLYDDSFMLDESHIDLGNPDSYTFVKALFDEFLDGDDPVFQSDTFHIGADEYKRESKYGEDFRKFVDEMVKYINNKGLNPRMWASLGGGGIQGTTPVDNRVTANYWAYSWADFTKMLDDGYTCINTSTELYVVPGKSTAYHDYLPLEQLYENWDMSLLGANPVVTPISPAHPLLIGGETAIWHDREMGASEFDYFDRIKDQVVLMSEKGWYGQKDEDQTSAEFMERVSKLANRAPDANPARDVESESDTVVNYDFEETTATTVKDTSGNGYDGRLNDIAVSEGRNGQGLGLDGKGSLSLPFDSIGFPYTVSMDLLIDESTPENAVLFSGKDGTLLLNYNGEGKILYERKRNSYIFDYPIETDRWQNIMLSCDEFGMHLYIDGVFIADAQYLVDRWIPLDSATFVLPTENIGEGVVGKIDNFNISKKFNSYNDVTGIGELDYSNLALNKAVSVSGLETPGVNTGEMVVDNNLNTKVGLNAVDDAWLTVDLGNIYSIDKVQIEFSEYPNKYQIQVSTDGTNWKTVHENLWCNGGVPGTDTITLDDIYDVRYVKYQQLQQYEKSTGDKHSGSFTEFRVFGYTGTEVYMDVLAAAKEALVNTSENDENKDFLACFNKNVTLLEDILIGAQASLEEKSFIAKQIKIQTEKLLAGDTAISKVDTSKLETLLDTEVNRNMYVEELLASYDKAVKNGRYALIDLYTDQARINSVVAKLEAAIAKLEEEIITVTSSLEPWNRDPEQYKLAHLVDRNINTFTWLVGEQKVDDYLQFEFNKAKTIRNVQLEAYLDPGQTDYLNFSDVEVSMDGQNWTKVGEILPDLKVQLIRFNPIEVKYVRFVITEGINKWIKLSEVSFNVLDTVDLEALLGQFFERNAYTPSTYNNYETVKATAQAVFDKIDKTQEEVDQATSDLTIAIAGLTLKGDKSLIQAELDIINALDPNDYSPASWQAITKAIIEVTSEMITAGDELTGKKVIQLVEKLRVAKSNLVLMVEVNRALLQKYIDDNDLTAIDGSLYLTAGSVVIKQALEDALALLETANEPTAQDFVNALTKLQEARANLILRATVEEISKLQTIVDMYEEGKYTSDSWAAFVSTLEHVKATIKENEMSSNDVTQLKADLLEAALQLVRRGDITRLEKVINDLDAIDESLYTEKSYADLQTVLEEAKVAVKDPNITTEIIDSLIERLYEAKDNLVRKDPTKPDGNDDNKPGVTDVTDNSGNVTDSNSNKVSVGGEKTGDYTETNSYLSLSLLTISLVLFINKKMKKS